MLDGFTPVRGVYLYSSLEVRDCSGRFFLQRRESEKRIILIRIILVSFQLMKSAKCIAFVSRMWYNENDAVSAH